MKQEFLIRSGTPSPKATCPVRRRQLHQYRISYDRHPPSALKSPSMIYKLYAQVCSPAARVA
jgi:hypothetical protein